MDPARLLLALSFASIKHINQRRKDAESSPYINHPIAVAHCLAAEGGVTDEAILMAAILHDTVEDTNTTFEELRDQFGLAVADLVRELTDDKSLPKPERKRMQIAHARMATAAAKQLKIADKICNVRDIADAPPSSWTLERREEYLDWAAQVCESCRGINKGLEEAFDSALAEARRRVRDTHR